MRNYILSALCMILVTTLQVKMDLQLFTFWWWVTTTIAAYAMNPFFNMAYEAIKRSVARRREAQATRADLYSLLEVHKAGRGGH